MIGEKLFFLSSFNKKYVLLLHTIGYVIKKEKVIIVMFKKGLFVIIVGLLLSCGKSTWAQKLDTNYKSMNYPTKQTDASFKGGMGAMILFIDENLQLSNKKGLKATVLIHINISEEGAITQVNILSGINKGVNKAIVEVIQKMPKWNPATVNGVAIPSEQVIGYNINY